MSRWDLSLIGFQSSFSPMSSVLFFSKPNQVRWRGVFTLNASVSPTGKQGTIFSTSIFFVFSMIYSISTVIKLFTVNTLSQPASWKPAFAPSRNGNIWPAYCGLQWEMPLFSYYNIWSCTRCGTYFGTTVEAVQCFTYRTEWNVWTCEKETKYYSCFGVWKHTLFWGVREKDFFTLSPSYKQSPKNRGKSLGSAVLQLRWLISTWWDENMILIVFSACYEIHWNWFCGRKQTKNAKIRRGAFVSRRVLW